MDDDIKNKIYNDPDFIAIKRFDYSIEEFIKRYSSGAPNHIIAQALNLTEEEFEKEFALLLEKLKTLMS
ncbi:MAG: hypothetical protein KGO96_07580 [Elusimicrobia bacterium]|nr:hypothetical protein [Elusimicrobiota bacterium]